MSLYNKETMSSYTIFARYITLRIASLDVV